MPAYNVTDPQDPLTAAAVIARLNDDMYRALQQNEQLDDLLAETRDTLTSRINVLKDQLRLREEQCSRLEAECEEYGSIVANKDAEIAELKDKYEHILALLNAERANPPMLIDTERMERLQDQNEDYRRKLENIAYTVQRHTRGVVG
jgi:predicted methyltransferase